MTKSLRNQSGIEPVTMESPSTTLRDHTAMQYETNNEFRASIRALEAKLMSKIEDLEKKTQDRYEELQEKMTSNFDRLCELIAKKDSKSMDLEESSPPPYRHPNYQVHNPITEPGRNSISEEGMERNTIKENIDEFLKRLTLPLFSGTDTYGWFALAERYFRIGGYDERRKLEIVSVSLAGDVLSWFNSETHRSNFTCWRDFKERLIVRFSKEKFRDSSQPFFAVKQTGTIAQYINMFEDFSTQVTGLTDTQREGIFMNGLKPAMREVVNMSKPVDLPEMIATSYQMEDSALYKMVCRERNQEGQSSGRQFFTKSAAPPSNNSEGQLKQQQIKNGGSTDKSREQRPQLHLTDNQIAEKKRLGLCFTCDDKWSRQHWCPNRHLKVLTVVNGIEMKIVDQSLVEMEEEEEAFESTLMSLSFNSFVRISSPTTTKVTGKINKNRVVVMLDSGATHSFISPSTVMRNKLLATVNPNLNVVLGTGISVQGSGVCRNVKVMLPSMTFTADFIVLELGNAYIILGVQWLVGYAH